MIVTYSNNWIGVRGPNHEILREGAFPASGELAEADCAQN
jgi:hypothetical protein